VLVIVCVLPREDGGLAVEKKQEYNVFGKPTKKIFSLCKVFKAPRGDDDVVDRRGMVPASTALSAAYGFSSEGCGWAY